MIDARISVGLPAHPKTKKLIRRLKSDGAAWRLVCLFLWAAANKPDGDLSGMTAEDIELAVDWPGADGDFVTALIDVGFIDGEEGAFFIHDWTVHNPWAAGAEARSEKSRWAGLCKQHGRQKAAEMMPEYAARLPDSASGTPKEVPDSASGTPLADSGSAPFLSFPSPYQSQQPISEQAVEVETSPPAAPSATAKRGSRLPADWQLPKPWGEWAMQEKPAWAADDVRRCSEKFRDHWLAKSGQGATKVDWQATWRNWVRNEGDPPLARASPSRINAQAATLSALTGGLTDPKPRNLTHAPAAYLPAA